MSQMGMSDLLKLNPHLKPAFDGPKIAKDLVTKVASKLQVLDAYLFGSSAEGKNTPNSDLDILLVIPDKQDKKDYFVLVGSPFFSPVAVDWIIMNLSEFQEKKELGGVASIAFLNGLRILKERSQSE